MLWLFSGTSDGNKIAQEKKKKNYPLKVFVASQYGKTVAAEILPQNIIEAGRMNEDEIFAKGEQETPHKVIDATHPFALEISKNLMRYCQKQDIPYIRYERPEETVTGEYIHYVNDVGKAAEKAESLGKRILLTLGSKNIEDFLCDELRGRVYIRMLPDPQLIEDLLSKDISPDRIIAIQGPFSISMNHAMMKDYSIDCLVTKSSGKEGGVPQKVEAAKQLGIPVIIIKRPELTYPNLFHNGEDVVNFVNNSQC